MRGMFALFWAALFIMAGSPAFAQIAVKVGAYNFPPYYHTKERRGVVADLIPPFKGSVKVDTADDPTRRPIAMVFQAANLMPWRRVKDNVTLGLEGIDVSDTIKRERIEWTLDLVGLTESAGASTQHFPPGLVVGGPDRVLPLAQFEGRAQPIELALGRDVRGPLGIENRPVEVPDDRRDRHTGIVPAGRA